MYNLLKIIVIFFLCGHLSGCISEHKNPSSATEEQIIPEVNPAIEFISTIHCPAGTGQYDERWFNESFGYQPYYDKQTRTIQGTWGGPA